MLNQRRATQAVSKVILPDKSHSSDEIPAQQLWAADIQNILILCSGQKPTRSLQSDKTVQVLYLSSFYGRIILIARDRISAKNLERTLYVKSYTCICLWN